MNLIPIPENESDAAVQAEVEMVDLGFPKYWPKELSDTKKSHWTWRNALAWLRIKFVQIRKYFQLLLVCTFFGAFAITANGQPRISVTTTTDGRLLSPLRFFQANADLISNAVVTVVLSANTNQVWPKAGANVTTSTNANTVTINADVSHTEVTAASNAAVAINTLTSNSIPSQIATATNNMGIASGLMAFRGTNGFAPTNNATTSSFGLVKPDGTTITIANGVISSVATGSGNVTGPNSSTDGTFPLFNGSSGQIIKASGFSPSSFDIAGAATAATNGLQSAAYWPSNHFALTNVATSSTLGLIKPDNSTLTVAADGTLSSAVGGGNVNGTGSSTAGHFAIMANTSATAITNSQYAPSDFDSAGAATSATNSIGPISGMSAFVPTNRFASATNANLVNPLFLDLGKGFFSINSDHTIHALGNTAGPLMNDGSGGGGFISAPTFNAANLTNMSAATLRGTVTNPVSTPALTLSGVTHGILKADSGGAVAAVTDNLGVLTNDSSGNLGYDNTFAHTNQLLQTTNLSRVSAFAKFTVDTNLTPSWDGNGLSNLVSAPLSTDTNIVMEKVGGGLIPFSLSTLISMSGSGSGFPLSADANFGGFGGTNVSKLRVGGPIQSDTLTVTNGFTNQTLTASSLVMSDTNKKMASVPNGSGVLTNDASGNFGYVPLIDAGAAGGGQIPYLGAATNLLSSTNNTEFQIVLAPSSNQTNYPLDFNNARKVEIFTANTNANITFVNANTNRSIDLYVNALTSSVPCNVTFPPHIRLNHYALLTVTNGQSGYFHIDFFNGIDPTNAVVTGGDYYTIQ